MPHSQIGCSLTKVTKAGRPESGKHYATVSFLPTVHSVCHTCSGCKRLLIALDKANSSSRSLGHALIVYGIIVISSTLHTLCCNHRLSSSRWCPSCM